MTYHFTHRTRGTAVIEAARFERTGSGTVFYGEAGEMLAAFADGEVTAVWPSDVEFNAPAEPGAPGDE